MPNFTVSKSKNKKYDVVYNGKTISFGDSRYQHYKDQTGLGKFSNLDHNDKERRKLYRARASKIVDKQGNLTYLDKNSPNYWAYHYLW